MSEIITRTFEFEELKLRSSSDGRTLVGRAAPIGVAQVVSDGDGSAYREGFKAGAFERAVKVPNRVSLAFRHSPGFSDQLGHGAAFREEDGYLLATFRLYEAAADKTREMVEADAVAGMSVGFYPLQSRREDGITWRTAVHLDHVGLAPVGQYPGAEVLSVREAEPTPALDEARSWLESMKAH